MLFLNEHKEKSQREKWRVTRWMDIKKSDERTFTRTALFMIDAEMDEVLEFKEGYYW